MYSQKIYLAQHLIVFGSFLKGQAHTLLLPPKTERTIMQSPYCGLFSKYDYFSAIDSSQRLISLPRPSVYDIYCTISFDYKYQSIKLSLPSASTFPRIVTRDERPDKWKYLSSVPLAEILISSRLIPAYKHQQTSWLTGPNSTGRCIREILGMLHYQRRLIRRLSTPGQT